MNDFHETTLGDVLTFQRGFDITKSAQSEGNVPIVSSSGVSSYHNIWKVKGPGVIIGRKGTLGTVHFIESNYWPHDTTLWVKDFKGNDPRFLSYFLQILKLENFDVGASNPTLNRNHIHKLKIIFPTKVEIQKRIGAILSAYDALIENNQQRIVLLERLAEDIYREWFVRLRFPGYESVKVVKGIPETWDNTRFGKFCMLKRGYDLPDKHVVPGEFPVMASTSIKTFHNEFKAKPPVITTGRSGSLGTVLIVHSKAWPLNTALYVKDYFENSPYLVFYTLQNMGLEAFNSGAGVPTLNRNHINGIKIAVPDKDLQRRFDCIVSPIHKQIEHVRKENALLTTTKESLLLRLLSGKLSVESLDIQLPLDIFKELKPEPTAAHA